MRPITSDERRHLIAQRGLIVDWICELRFSWPRGRVISSRQYKRLRMIYTKMGRCLGWGDYFDV